MTTVHTARLHIVCWRAALLILLSLLTVPQMGGCVSPTYRQMRSEMEIPALAEAAKRFYAARNDTLLAPTTEREGDDAPPLHIAIHRLGPPHAQAGDRVIVFLHGALSDSQSWRHVAGYMLDDYRLWLVDFPGLGASDRVRPASLPEGAFSPPWLAERAAQALEYALAESAERTGAAPASVTLVGHSLGGAAALHLLSDPHAHSEHSELLARIDSAVLIAPLDANLPIVNQDSLRAARVTGFEVLLATLTATARERISRGVAQNAADPARAMREEVDAKYAIMTDARTRSAAQAMLLHAIPNQDAKPDWHAIEAITESYSQVRTPILILWGRRDESLPVAMGYKLASQLPRAQLRIFPDAKHSPHLDYPNVVAELVREFVSAGAVAARKVDDDADASDAPAPLPATRLIEPKLIQTPGAPPEQPGGGSREPPADIGAGSRTP